MSVQIWKETVATPYLKVAQRNCLARPKKDSSSPTEILGESEGPRIFCRMETNSFGRNRRRCETFWDKLGGFYTSGAGAGEIKRGF